MITKTDFIANLATEMNASQSAATAAFDAFWATVEKGLKKDGKITLTGIGIFELKKKPARMGINPATKEKVKIAASNAPQFKFAKTVKEKFNKK
ncbi:MAG: HU family DNA-binding protein [Firmicutes bacterium]|nr:HU family DNA-binding protein [Bacillota bacterium]